MNKRAGQSLLEALGIVTAVLTILVFVAERRSGK